MKNVEEKALKKKLEEVDSCLASKFRLSVQLAQRAAQAQLQSPLRADRSSIPTAMQSMKPTPFRSGRIEYLLCNQVLTSRTIYCCVKENWACLV